MNIRHIIIPFFVGMLFLPLVGSFTGVEEHVYHWMSRPMSMNEKRMLAPAPVVKTFGDWETYPEQFETFWDDHLGWRYTMIRSSNFIRKRLFPDSDGLSVLVGREGAFFYKQNRVLEYTQHRAPYSEDELHEVASKLLNNNERLKKLGIQYLFVLAPNKHSIYPEYLPSHIEAADTTRLDQLVQYLNTYHPGKVQVLDLRPVLLEQKKAGQLYEATGTHWSELGAFYGYQAIVRTLNIQPFMLDEMEVELRDGGPYELATQLGGALTPEKLPGIVPNAVMDSLALLSQKVVLADTTGLNKSAKIRVPFKYTIADNDKTVMVFRDSFFTRLVPFFKLHFGSSTYYWQGNLNWPAIEEERPAYVVHEMVERSLAGELNIE